MTETVRLVLNTLYPVCGALVVLLVLPLESTSAQVLCRCAIRPLEAFICENDLTAQVRVRFGLSLPNGNRVYRARVLQTFQGEAARDIWIETPASCGFPLRTGRTYAVSINVGENGVYSTFACSSFVKQWRELSPDELALLDATECFPTCDDVECATGQSCILEPVVCIRAPCPPLPVCVPEGVPAP
jgi:hypothetical protein